MKHRSIISLGILAVATCAFSSVSIADEPENRPEQSAVDGEGQAKPDHPKRKLGVEIQINPDALRSRLMRSIQRAQMILETHEAAIEKLDAGASPIEVLAEIKKLGDQRGPGRKLRAPNGSAEHGQDSDRMPPEERKRIQSFLMENFPDLHRDFQQVAQMNPMAADRLLGRMRPQIVEILMLQDREPEFAAIKMREMHTGLMFVEASRLYRKAKTTPNTSEADVKAAFDHMESVAVTRFDVQLEAKAYEIAKLEARLNQLKSSVESVKETRDDEVQRMLSTSVRGTNKPSSSRDD